MIIKTSETTATITINALKEFLGEKIALLFCMNYRHAMRLHGDTFTIKTCEPIKLLTSFKADNFTEE